MMLISSIRLLIRQSRAFSVRMLWVSLALAAMTVSGIATTAVQLKTALGVSSTKFIAADRQLSSPRDVPEEWLETARKSGLEVARSIEFSSMLFGNERFQLVSVKAVDEAYPLKGELQVAGGSGERLIRDSGPPPGSLWMQKRLFPLMGATISGATESTMNIGDRRLRVDFELLQEPDVGFQMAGMAPRVMMNLQDVESTGVIQPGSRLTWRYYFAGKPNVVAAFEEWLQPRLDSTQRWLGVKEGRPAIASALDKTETYLLLGGSLAVFLACAAIAMAARQFALDQVNQVAILKTLGLTGGQVISRYIIQLFTMGVVSLILGLLLGQLLAFGARQLLQTWVPELSTMPAIIFDPGVVLLCAGTITISLFGFALPQFMQLRRVAPMQVLRDQSASLFAWSWSSSLVAVVSMLALLFLYAKNLKLVALLSIALLLVSAAVFVVSLLVFSLLAWYLNREAKEIGALRFALQAMMRKRWHSLVQLSVCSITIMLFALMLLARGSLVGDWQRQLPDDAPNHFLINIAPNDLAKLEGVLTRFEIKSAGLYPMVRGRLSHINGEDVKVAVTKDVAALNRELNLTWASGLPADNAIVEGNWWPAELAGGGSGLKLVSVESRLADNLGLGLGDRLRFSIGGRELEAQVGSIRTVQWDSMRPNFYVMFEPGALDGFPATYITSFYLGTDNKNVLNSISESFPTVSILELDQLVAKVRQIIEQVSLMVEGLIALIFVASLLVVGALIGSQFAERQREAALLRTMGARRGFIMNAQWLEYAVLGLLAGAIAVFGAEVSMWQMQKTLFEADFSPHFGLWLAVPFVSALLLAAYSYVQMRRVPSTSPMLILRSEN